MVFWGYVNNFRIVSFVDHDGSLYGHLRSDGLVELHRRHTSRLALPATNFASTPRAHGPLYIYH
eukprot:1784393-Amphidinium_carterae.1